MPVAHVKNKLSKGRLHFPLKTAGKMVRIFKCNGKHIHLEMGIIIIIIIG